MGAISLFRYDEGGYSAWYLPVDAVSSEAAPAVVFKLISARSSNPGRAVVMAFQEGIQGALQAVVQTEHPDRSAYELYRRARQG